MSTSQLAERPATLEGPAQRPGRAALRKARSRKTALLARYVGYVGYFVGAGLISGAVVHHPLDPTRYTRIAGYGVLVFLAATVLNEFVLARHKLALPRMLVVMGASLLLSFGIGMLSGGLQHFEDFPARAAVLIPAGIALSFLAFVIKDEGTSWRRVFGLAGLSVLVVVLISFFGLHQLASTLSEQPGAGGHGHGSGTEPQPEEQQSQLDRPGPAGSPEASTSPAAGEAPTETGSEDGHNH
ncbi:MULTISPECIES: hypothetical protein [Streptomyces]|uniref:Uncharacterized protein n=2 Tax=Streptomyces TaxID=1883 RepID=A0A1E7M0U3_9ACTN|nr:MULTISPECIES: hypothetical protein [Streptomyces]OEV22110.1 hypothetical protein AN221_04150 [Streptomyces nanshensis]ONI49480.1 hypothetical protein STIB_65700 [Streptomyces sp. IB2014 011-1]RDV51711.1 hypothetical protein DDV98_11925 [Streptomyces sp. IB2014 011-12]